MLQEISVITKGELPSTKELGKRIQTTRKSFSYNPHTIEASLRPPEQQTKSQKTCPIRSDDQKLNNRYCLITLAKTGAVVATTIAVYAFAKTMGFLPDWLRAKREESSTVTGIEGRNDQSVAINEDNSLNRLVSHDYKSLLDLPLREGAIVNFEEIDVKDIALSKKKKDDEEDLIEIDTATAKSIEHDRQLLEAPAVQNPLPDQEIAVGEPLNLLLNNVFSNFVSLNATLSNGDSLPSWLSLSFVANPTFVGFYNTPGTVNDVTVSGTTAFVAGSSGLLIINVSNPSTSTLLGSYDTPGSAYRVAIHGTTAFVSAGYRLLILDVSNPSTPTLLGSYDTLVFGSDVAVSGTIAYVADGTNSGSGLLIIDVNNPSTPTLLGSYDTPGSAQGVTVIGTIAYVADGISGLQIIDVNNPSAPTLLGSYDTPEDALASTIIDATAFVADRSGGLQILDVSNPTSPALLGFYNTPDPAYGITVSGTIALVADFYSGLLIIDVSDRRNPILLSSYNTPGRALDVTVSDRTAFVADYDIGSLQIIHIGDWSLSGTPRSGDQRSFSVRITADDGFGETVDDIFDLTVKDTTPTLNNLMLDQSIPIGTSLTYQFSSFTFNDIDGDVLTYNAIQNDGTALPSWLTFDSATRTFSGVPRSGDQGIYQIKVVADDGFGGTVEDVFQLTVLNQRPDAIIPLSSQLENIGLETIHVDQPFDFQFQEFSFIDADGDHLSYNATQAGGAPLPNWMSFNPVNRRFTGTPQTGDQAVLAITVTADDGFGATVGNTFVLTVANRAPNGGSIPNQTAIINQAFGYQVAPGTFTDLDDDPLTYSATLSNGYPLPTWLSFDSGNQTFSGTPGLSDRGVISVRVLADDGRATDYTDFILEVGNVAPEVVSPLSSQLLPEQETISIGDAWSFQFSTESFDDPDGDILSYTATQDDDTSLPSWLTFNSNTQTFSGTPQSGDQGIYTLKVTADDGFGGLISDSLTITVENRTPMVQGSLNNQNLTVGQYLSYPLNTALFSDPDGDSLSYSATLEDGSPLPGWLNFNPETKTFTGTPLSGNQGTLIIVVTGQDGYGNSVESSFSIDISNQRPIVTRQLTEQRIVAGQSFSFPLPSGLIIDPDGDDLRYTATLSDGNPLPDWLNFDNSTRTFTGTPESPETLTIKISAEDPYGERTETTFDLRILGGTGGNIAPTLTLPIQDQQADIGAFFAFTFDSQTFTDGNGDVLHYEASLENGDPLPSWLDFDATDRTFRGTPRKEDLGAIKVLITASDPQKLTAIDTFTITIVDTTNYAPVVINPISQQTADVDKEFRFTVPDTTFRDPNGDTLHYSVLSLPNWLHFDLNTRTFSGTPGRGDTDAYANRDYVIELMASDGQLTTSTSFIISVVGASYWELVIKIGTPLLSALISAFGVYKKRGKFLNPFRKNAYQKPAETALTGKMYQRELSVPSNKIERVKATITDMRGKKRDLPGGELPGWLTYNSESNQLFGTPRTHDTGAVTIQVLGVAGMIKEQFDLRVQDQDSFRRNDLEMQPIHENRSRNALYLS